MTDPSTYDKIEDYLFNRLPAAEARQFEQRIAEDPALAEEVEKHRFEHQAMEVLIERETKEKMKRWSVEAGSGGNGGRQLRRLGFILASIGLIALAVFLLLPEADQRAGDAEPERKNAPAPAQEPPDVPTAPDSQPSPADPDATSPVPADQQRTPPPDMPIAEEEPATDDRQYIAMAEELYEAENLTGASRAGEEAALSTIERAFKDEDYEAVVAAFRDTALTDLRAYRLLGHAHFRLAQYEAAAQAFETVLRGNDPARAEEVQYNYLLALLAQGEVNSPRFTRLLETLLDDPGHPDHEGALELQSRLE